MANKEMRQSILGAVNRVVARSGLGGTTIDAVAAEAGVSKGGVLYYFPSKRELLVGMIDRYETDFYRRREAVLAKLPDSRLKLLKATVMVMLADMEAARDDIPNFGTVLDDVDVRKRVGDFKRRLFKDNAHNAPSSETVAMIMYVVDGMWMDIRFNPSVLPKSGRVKAGKELLKYIDAIDK